MNYNTKQKTAIMKCIQATENKHFTVDGICKLLIEKGENVGRTTVYRYLEALTKDGALRKYAAEQGESVCYQFIEKDKLCQEHFHLKCEKCGSLIHMECDELNEVAKHIKSHHGFCLNPLKTVIYGVCEGCAQK